MQEEQKQAILLLRSQGEPYAKIADYLELSPNTVKSFCCRNKVAPPIGESQTAVKETTLSVCKNCGSALTQTTGGRKKIFCSDKCRYTWWNWNKHKKFYRLTCQYCGKNFINFGSQNRKFCSRECYLLSRHDKASL